MAPRLPFIPALLSFAGLVSGGLNTWNFGVFAVSTWLLLCNYGVIRVKHGIALGFAIFFAVLGIGLIVSAFLPDRRKRAQQAAAPAGMVGVAPGIRGVRRRALHLRRTGVHRRAVQHGVR